MSYVVYLDVLLLLNFCMDFLLLWAAGRFLRCHTALWRLLLAAGLGGGYGAAVVLQLPAWLWSPPLALLLSWVMLLTAYRWQGWRALLRLSGVFYLLACLLGGAALAAASLLQSRGLGRGLPGGLSVVRWACLVVALPVALIVARRGWNALRQSWRRENFHTHLVIRLAGRSVSLNALIDTGNDLREPLSGLPVLVADYRAVASLLPHSLKQAWCAAPERPDEVLRLLSQATTTGATDQAGAKGGTAYTAGMEGWLRRLRLVPFSAIGRANGMLLGFRADEVVLQQQGRLLRGQAVIALAPGRLAGDGYQAVVNPLLLEQGKEGAA